jgi:RNA polymerase sigma factor (sigma-70 family)
MTPVHRAMPPRFRRANEDAAFERLYQRHVKDVYRYTYALLGERADAEDVTQTAFLNAYRAFKNGERPEKPQNWLIAIAHNVCRQRFRQQQRRPDEVEFVEALAAAPEQSEGPSAEDLRRAFSQLPPNQRAALVMRELEGRSYAEIAEVIGISVSALETLLFRARRALREQLEEQLTCNEAGLAISKQFDDRLAPDEQRSLRAHLRACPDCASAAQRQRGQRRALKAMLAVPLPQSLASFFGGAGAATGGAAVAAGGTGVVLKAAAVLGAGALVGGGGYVAVKDAPLLHHRRHAAKAEVRAAVAAPRADAPAAAPAAAPHDVAAATRRASRIRAAVAQAKVKAAHKRLQAAKHGAAGSHRGKQAAKKPAHRGRAVSHAAKPARAQVKPRHAKHVRAHTSKPRTHGGKGGPKHDVLPAE